jgi:predicted ribosomally synthesized peptide with SipW-like signal peptide
MKRLNISNKIKLGVTACAMALCIGGGTLAWYTASNESTQNISLGSLHVTNTLQAPEESTNYEPGTTTEMSGTISNKGSLASVTRIDNTSQIKFVYSDDNMTPIPTAERKFVDAPKGAIQFAFGPESGDYFSNEGAYWFTDGTNTYLLLDPGASEQVKVGAAFNGDVMSSKYQDATIKLGTKTNTTQVIDGAMLKEFGTTEDQLTPLENPAARSSRSNTDQHAKVQRALEHLHKLAGRK